MNLSRAVEALIVCTCTLIFTLMVPASVAVVFLPLLTGHGLTIHDTVSFWSAGQQLAHGKNPYDAVETLRQERAAGLGSSYDSLIMRNPPFALPLVLPLGYLTQRGAMLLWSALLLGAFFLSVRLLWSVFGRPEGPLRWLPYLFAPALICIIAGQSAMLPLLGIALFYRYQCTRPFAAGAALWLCMLKPHLILPFAAVLVLSQIRERRFRILGGAATALAASLALAWVLDPAAWSQYAQMARNSGIAHEYIPCIGVALRFGLQPGALWLQWLPCAIGSTFAVFYYWRNRASWDWNSSGGLLLLISLVTAPYAWVTDTTLALPALMYAATQRPSRFMLFALAAVMAVLEGQFLAGIPWHSRLYLWPAAAWMLWYLFHDAFAPAADPLDQQSIAAAECP